MIGFFFTSCLNLFDEENICLLHHVLATSYHLKGLRLQLVYCSPRG